MDLAKLSTETRNPNSMMLDTMSVSEILSLMNREDQTVPKHIQEKLPQIEAAVEKIIQQFKKGGRLIYLGAGTSGRLGVLDAAECVPTFGTDPSLVQGLIAGGQSAMTVAVEGAEDSMSLAQADLTDLNLNKNDSVVGLAASGRTPYVIGALKYAKQVGAATVSIACNEQAEISKYAEFPIEVVTGPEVLTGSTRLKAGTAQKLILNMISTTSMIKLGKAYQNLMIDVKPTNDKLIERSKRIIMQATDCDYQTAEKTFVAADQDVKVAIIMVLTGADKATAIKNLQKNDGFVRKAMRED